MYGKIFETMYDGTLAANWEALVTFQQMIVLANQDGIVDVTPRALASRTGIPIDVIERGIEILEATDNQSRTPDMDGQRIHRIDEHRTWGWQIVNYEKYATLATKAEQRSKNRERAKKYREKRARPCATVRDRARPCAKSRHIDVDVDVDLKKTTNAAFAAAFDQFWKNYPRNTGNRKRGKEETQTEFKKLPPEDWELVSVAATAYSKSKKVEDGYIRDPIRFIKKGFWRDFLEPVETESGSTRADREGITETEKARTALFARLRKEGCPPDEIDRRVIEKFGS